MARHKKEYHQEIGHFCVGCPFSNKFHRGCVTDGNVEVQPENNGNNGNKIETSTSLAPIFSTQEVVPQTGDR